MTPTAARWISASRALTDARIAYRAAMWYEAVAWIVLSMEVQDGLANGGVVDPISLCRRGRAGVPGGAGVRGVADDAGSKGGAA